MSNDPFVHDDAAYVLGALSDAERDAFEAHLAECDECTRRVAESQPVVGLLAGLDEAAFTDVDTVHVDEPLPETLLPGLLRAVRKEQRRRVRLVGALTGLAAASVIALGVVAWPSAHHAGPPAQAMAAVVATPVHATAAISSTNWGTKIVLTCHYDGVYATGIAYNLIVVDKQNLQHEAGSWTLSPDHVATFVGGTALPRNQISKVEITAGSTPILQLNL
ncbi:MAG TPA: zf-HC2 domain-containing protein [Jatrophihabitantaceae bacterium]|jgi:hypothetical protein|nr:zf-HC2 domain-containing protein [Jatrophihabitantaceae bacterium]